MHQIHGNGKILMPRPVRKACNIVQVHCAEFMNVVNAWRLQFVQKHQNASVSAEQPKEFLSAWPWCKEMHESVAKRVMQEVYKKVGQNGVASLLVLDPSRPEAEANVGQSCAGASDGS